MVNRDRTITSPRTCSGTISSEHEARWCWWCAEKISNRGLLFCVPATERERLEHIHVHGNQRAMAGGGEQGRAARKVSAWVDPVGYFHGYA